MATKPAPEDDSAEFAELDAEIFAMFAQAEAEVGAEVDAAASPDAPSPDGKNPAALTDDQVREWSKLSGAPAPTAVPSGTPSKVSPALQRFAMQPPSKPKK